VATVSIEVGDYIVNSGMYLAAVNAATEVWSHQLLTWGLREDQV